MSEYHQDGIITTIHNLHEVFDLEGYLIELEKKLENFSKHLRLSLLLPCLYDESHDWVRSLKDTLRLNLLQDNPDLVISGMAIGWDTWLAEEA